MVRNGDTRVLVPAAPAQASVEVIADDGKAAAREDPDHDCWKPA